MFQLQKSLNKNELQDLLEANGQAPAVGLERTLDRLADIMTFGALVACPECKNGQLVFRLSSNSTRNNFKDSWQPCSVPVVFSIFKVNKSFKFKLNSVKCLKLVNNVTKVTNRVSTIYLWKKKDLF